VECLQCKCLTSDRIFVKNGNLERLNLCAAAQRRPHSLLLNLILQLHARIEGGAFNDRTTIPVDASYIFDSLLLLALDNAGESIDNLEEEKTSLIESIWLFLVPPNIAIFQYLIERVGLIIVEQCAVDIFMIRVALDVGNTCVRINLQLLDAVREDGSKDDAANLFSLIRDKRINFWLLDWRVVLAKVFLLPCFWISAITAAATEAEMKMKVGLKLILQSFVFLDKLTTLTFCICGCDEWTF
jgi:putative effector of murein hydrolase LrgA (UPF0299 family)